MAKISKKNNGGKGRKGGSGNGGRKTQGSALNSLMTMMTAASLQNNGSNRRPMKEKIYRESGSDFIGALNILGSTDYATVANRILSSVNVEPSAFPGTRLSILGGLYERYRFRKFNLRYVPAVPNTLACQILWYFDTDPRDDPTSISSAAALIRQAIAHTGGQQWNFNHAKTNPLPQRIDDQWYYTDENTGDQVRFTRQAVGRMIQVTQLLDFNGVAPAGNIEAGSLYIDWECEFQLPQIDADVVTRALGTSGPPPTPASLEVFPVARVINQTAGSVGPFPLATIEVTEDQVVPCLDRWSFSASTSDSYTLKVVSGTDLENGPVIVSWSPVPSSEEEAEWSVDSRLEMSVGTYTFGLVFAGPGSLNTINVVSNFTGLTGGFSITNL